MSGGSNEGIRKRDENVKKDILAAITFLATGLLFYVIQADGKADEHFSSAVGCDAAETVFVGQTAPEKEVPVILDSGVTRDS
jgi:hypothetical protein